MGLILRSQDSQPNYIDEMYIEEKKNARDNFKFIFFLWTILLVYELTINITFYYYVPTITNMLIFMKICIYFDLLIILKKLPKTNLF